MPVLSYLPQPRHISVTKRKQEDQFTKMVFENVILWDNYVYSLRSTLGRDQVVITGLFAIGFLKMKELIRGHHKALIKSQLQRY